VFDFDKIIERKSDKCRKWDHAFVCSRFGDVPEGFIPLWIADMDFTSPPAVIEGFQRIVEHGTFGYTWCFDEFYDAVIAFQRTRHQVEVEKSWITLTYGTVSTLHYTVQAFCTPGDSVMMNTPVYDPFAMAAQRQGVRVLANPLPWRKTAISWILIWLKISSKPTVQNCGSSARRITLRAGSGARMRYARSPISVSATARFWWSMRFTPSTF
jgi:bifunctional pyridoxal-dependent enzyme with beta-cystathionase and maltose regulon repressor activities